MRSFDGKCGVLRKVTDISEHSALRAGVLRLKHEVIERGFSRAADVSNRLHTQSVTSESVESLNLCQLLSIRHKTLGVVADAQGTFDHSFTETIQSALFQEVFKQCCCDGSGAQISNAQVVKSIGRLVMLVLGSLQAGRLCSGGTCGLEDLPALWILSVPIEDGFCNVLFETVELWLEVSESSSRQEWARQTPSGQLTILHDSMGVRPTLTWKVETFDAGPQANCVERHDFGLSRSRKWKDPLPALAKQKSLVSAVVQQYEAINSAKHQQGPAPVPLSMTPRRKLRQKLPQTRTEISRVKSGRTQEEHVVKVNSDGDGALGLMRHTLLPQAQGDSTNVDQTNPVARDRASNTCTVLSCVDSGHAKAVEDGPQHQPRPTPPDAAAECQETKCLAEEAPPRDLATQRTLEDVHGERLDVARDVEAKQKMQRRRVALVSSAVKSLVSCSTEIQQTPANAHAEEVEQYWNWEAEPLDGHWADTASDSVADSAAQQERCRGPVAQECEQPGSVVCAGAREHMERQTVSPNKDFVNTSRSHVAERGPSLVALAMSCERQRLPSVMEESPGDTDDTGETVDRSEEEALQFLPQRYEETAQYETGSTKCRDAWDQYGQLLLTRTKGTPGKHCLEGGVFHSAQPSLDACDMSPGHLGHDGSQFDQEVPPQLPLVLFPRANDPGANTRLVGCERETKGKFAGSEPQSPPAIASSVMKKVSDLDVEAGRSVLGMEEASQPPHPTDACDQVDNTVVPQCNQARQAQPGQKCADSELRSPLAFVVRLVKRVSGLDVEAGRPPFCTEEASPPPQSAEVHDPLENVCPLERQPREEPDRRPSDGETRRLECAVVSIMRRRSGLDAKTACPASAVEASAGPGPAGAEPRERAVVSKCDQEIRAQLDARPADPEQQRRFARLVSLVKKASELDDGETCSYRSDPGVTTDVVNPSRHTVADADDYWTSWGEAALLSESDVLLGEVAKAVVSDVLAKCLSACAAQDGTSDELCAPRQEAAHRSQTREVCDSRLDESRSPVMREEFLPVLHGHAQQPGCDAIQPVVGPCLPSRRLEDVDDYWEAWGQGWPQDSSSARPRAVKDTALYHGDETAVERQRRSAEPAVLPSEGELEECAVVRVLSPDGVDEYWMSWDSEPPEQSLAVCGEISTGIDVDAYWDSSQHCREDLSSVSTLDGVLRVEEPWSATHPTDTKHCSRTSWRHSGVDDCWENWGCDRPDVDDPLRGPSRALQATEGGKVCAQEPALAGNDIALYYEDEVPGLRDDGGDADCDRERDPSATDEYWMLWNDDHPESLCGEDVLDETVSGVLQENEGSSLTATVSGDGFAEVATDEKLRVDAYWMGWFQHAILHRFVRGVYQETGDSWSWKQSPQLALHDTPLSSSDAGCQRGTQVSACWSPEPPSAHLEDCWSHLETGDDCTLDVE